MAMQFNPQTGQWEDMRFNSVTDSYEEPIGPAMPSVPALEPLPPVPASEPMPTAPKQISPDIVQYLQSKQRAPASMPEMAPKVDEMPAPSKSNMDAYKQALMEQNQMQSGMAGAQLASSIGDALAGRDNSGTRAAFQQMRAQAKDSTMGELERQKTFSRDADENDPNSEKSKAFRKLVESSMPKIAQGYGKDWAKISAADGANIFKFGNAREQMDARKEQMQILMGQRKDAKDLAISEKAQALQTPFGAANTPDDAKQLKEAYEAKKNFDNKIQQMIELRSKYGGELLNREAVARGKQLSKDLLLEYKNMAKLGVLSKTDEDIINAIIPDDPLAFSMTPGQDPVMTKLKSFKSDSDKDFQTRVSTRTREGLKGLQSLPQGIDPRVESFMKKNNISDPNEALRILKEHGKI